MSDAQRQIARAVARLRRVARLEGVEAAIDEAVRDVIIPDVKVYPPERANQRYVRTFKLRDNWRVQKARRAGATAFGAAVNATPYAAEVMGTQDQKPIHQGRWRTERQVVDQLTPRVRQAVRAALLRRWGMR